MLLILGECRGSFSEAEILQRYPEHLIHATFFHMAKRIQNKGVIQPHNRGRP